LVHQLQQTTIGGQTHVDQHLLTSFQISPSHSFLPTFIPFLLTRRERGTNKQASKQDGAVSVIPILLCLLRQEAPPEKNSSMPNYTLRHQYADEPHNFYTYQGVNQSSYPWPFEPLLESNEATQPPSESILQTHAALLIGVLTGLTLMLTVIFIVMIYPIVADYIKEKMPVNPERLLKRYETIEAWLVTKVRCQSLSLYVCML
jgi:hypothetical protein